MTVRVRRTPLCPAPASLWGGFGAHRKRHFYCILTNSNVSCHLGLWGSPEEALHALGVQQQSPVTRLDALQVPFGLEVAHGTVEMTSYTRSQNPFSLERRKSLKITKRLVILKASLIQAASLEQFVSLCLDSLSCLKPVIRRFSRADADS